MTYDPAVCWHDDNPAACRQCSGSLVEFRVAQATAVCLAFALAGVALLLLGVPLWQVMPTVGSLGMWWLTR